MQRLDSISNARNKSIRKLSFYKRIDKEKEFLKTQPITILVSTDVSKNSWKEAIREDGLPWIHPSDLLGRENEPSLVYGVRAIPDNVLINGTGEIVARNLRGENLHNKVEEALNA